SSRRSSRRRAYTTTSSRSLPVAEAREPGELWSAGAPEAPARSARARPAALMGRRRFLVPHLAARPCPGCIIGGPPRALLYDWTLKQALSQNVNGRNVQQEALRASGNCARCERVAHCGTAGCSAIGCGPTTHRPAEH